MPAKSQAQQRLFGIARAIQKGEIKPGSAGGAARSIAKDVSAKSVRDFAKTSHDGLPPRKDCGLMREAQVQEIVRQVLEDGEEFERAEEAEEVAIARNILSLVDRLQASLSDWAPEQERHLTGIRAAAHQLIRMHSLGTNAENLPPGV